MAKNNKTDYVAWGLDDAVPGTIDLALAGRKKLLKKITRRLDLLTFIMVVSGAVQVALIATIMLAYF